ncbi:MAG: hypothetical protein ACW980_20140 [Promethearchaeota archaeon]
MISSIEAVCCSEEALIPSSALEFSSPEAVVDSISCVIAPINSYDQL